MDKAITQSTTPSGVTITPRKLRFDFSDTPRVWLSDPFKTHFMNALSVLIPHSERTVNEIMRKNVDRLSDSRLRDEVRSLIKQEGAHAAVHHASNKLLRQSGYPGVAFFEKLQKKFMSALRRVSTDAFEMAIPAAFEHFTSAISREFIQRHEVWTGHKINDGVKFASWHSLEEIEHQAVCYDAYRALYKSQWRLVLVLLFCWVPIFVLSTFTIQLYFLHKDRIIYRPRNWLPYFKFLFGSLALFSGGILKYRKKQFKPWCSSDEVLYQNALASFNSQLQ